MVEEQREDTFETTFLTHYKELYLHALSFVRNEEDARDIVNDVFEYVWNNLKCIDLSISLRPFLYRLTRTRCLDYLRHEKTKERFRLYYDSLPREMEVDYQEYEKLIQKIMGLIEELPLQTRNVFQKCFIEKKKYKEVGEELNISVNTIKTHIAKALRILRDELSDREIDIFLIIFQKE